VEFGGLSNRCSIIIQLETTEGKPLRYFQFNVGWLTKDEFQNIVRTTWKNYEVDTKLFASE
jgi:hypothetical protein